MEDLFPRILQTSQPLESSSPKKNDTQTRILYHVWLHEIRQEQRHCGERYIGDTWAAKNDKKREYRRLNSMNQIHFELSLHDSATINNPSVPTCKPKNNVHFELAICK